MLQQAGVSGQFGRVDFVHSTSPSFPVALSSPLGGIPSGVGSGVITWSCCWALEGRPFQGASGDAPSARQPLVHLPGKEGKGVVRQGGAWGMKLWFRD